MISPATITRLREAVDLQALAADYVTTKKNAGQYLCLCPWHSEKNPSCRIWKDHYHCFTCGAHGSSIDWVMHLEGVPFSAACKVLSERTGIPLDASKPVSRRAMQYAREEAALCKWWWDRYRARLREQLQEYFDAEDFDMAEFVGCKWRWKPEPAVAFAFFREQLTANERVEYREEAALYLPYAINPIEWEASSV